MRTNEEIKSVVREKYGELAMSAGAEQSVGCCGPSCGCSSGAVLETAEDYSALPGYTPAADLSLGCGIPTDVADIRPGDTVLDLGSGAGNDVFVARQLVGDTGRVIGVDMTEAMIERADANNRKLGYQNVEFRHGDIEKLPVESDSIDVVINNCVLNLVPDKPKAFAEMYRVLRPGGHFSVSDIVLDGELPAGVREAAELYAGCVSGAVQKEEYLGFIAQAGFRDVAVRKEKRYELSDDLLRGYLSEQELQAFRTSGASLISVTVSGWKR